MAVITQQNDTVDLISLRAFGTTAMSEIILDANPGLAAQGPVLEMGISVELPAQTVAPTSGSKINLWD